jgi:hypothetical protein
MKFVLSRRTNEFSYWERLYHGTSFVLHRASPLCPRPSPQSLERCIQSAGAYIDCMVDVLRRSNVPLTWMLVQGVLFAGLTMLVTARTSFRSLAEHSGLPFLLVELPAWTRKCSKCLAIINERWCEDLLSKLDTQFETLANDTLRLISSTLTARSNDSRPTQTNHPSRDESNPLKQAHMPSAPHDNNLHVEDEPMDFGADMTSDLDYIDTFREYLGIDGVQTFWDILSSDFQDLEDPSMPPGPNSTQIHGTELTSQTRGFFPAW